MAQAQRQSGEFIMRHAQTSGRAARSISSWLSSIRGAGRGAIATVMLLPLSAIGATPGDLDVSFGVGGIVITDIGGETHDHIEDYIYGLARQADGKIVAVGNFSDTTTGTGGFALARYRRDGQLDRTFGGDGRVVTELPLHYDGVAHAVVIQPNGGIVVGGYIQRIPEGFAAASDASSTQRTGFAVARYRPNGALDTSFGRNGFAITDRMNARLIYAIQLQADGKIVVAGGAADSTGVSQYALARFLPNGKLDETFGNRGVVVTDVGRGDYIRAMSIQPDGKIVVAGSCFIEALDQLAFCVARYRPNGSLDRSFGGDGVVSTFVAENYTPIALALQSDGKIVVGGRYFAADSDLALARYLPNGDLDVTFDGDGMTVVDLGGTDMMNALVLQPDNKIVVAGTYRDPSTFVHGFLLARFQADGLLDTTFSGDGYVVTNIGDGDMAWAQALLRQPNGKLVAAGFTRSSASTTDFALARYHGGPSDGAAAASDNDSE